MVFLSLTEPAFIAVLVQMATPISDVYSAVSRLALRHKAALVEGEVIGLVPEAACERDSEWMRQLIGFDSQTKILEERLAAPLAWPEP